MIKSLSLPNDYNNKSNCQYFIHIVPVRQLNDINYWNIGEEYVLEIAGIPKTNRIVCIGLNKVDKLHNLYCYLSHAMNEKELQDRLNQVSQSDEYYILTFKNLNQ